MLFEIAFDSGAEIELGRGGELSRGACDAASRRKNWRLVQRQIEACAHQDRARMEMNCACCRRANWSCDGALPARLLDGRLRLVSDRAILHNDRVDDANSRRVT